MRRTPRSVIIHAHLYQPPRQDPWLGEIPRELSAAPFRNWNARIERECYRPLTAARVLDADGKIVRMFNTLESVSFDVGATLLSWLDVEAPETYARIVAADRTSCERLNGHGNAIASPYHHVILPLCSRRDKITEIRWGIADFERRFGRFPEGMWLPETAVDEETLDVLADAGVRFTILAPHQVTGAPADGTPGKYRTASGKELGIFVYDGGLSHDVAFGSLGEDASAWEQRMFEDAARTLSMTAVDGETFGHHRPPGDAALTSLLYSLQDNAHAAITNPAAWLRAHPPHQGVELVAPSSWSCPHGVERWRGNCGCRAFHEETSQAWRGPLRDALEWLSGEVDKRFQKVLAPFASEPFTLRDDYAGVVAGGPDTAQAFLEAACRELDPAARTAVLEALEMQQSALSMFTSCGWFFDDVGGLETRLILRFAAHAVELCGPDRDAIESALLERLANAESNDTAVGTARDVYLAERRESTTSAMLAAAVHGVATVLSADANLAVPAAFRVSGRADGLSVERRATGRRWDVVAGVSQKGAKVSVQVTDERHDPLTFGLHDFPDRARLLIAAAMRDAIARTHFTEREWQALRSGVPAVDVVSSAVQTAVLSLPQAGGNDTVANRIGALLDYVALCDAGSAIPVDAQTAFASVRDQLPEPLATQLAERLGFTLPPGHDH